MNTNQSSIYTAIRSLSTPIITDQGTIEGIHRAQHIPAEELRLNAALRDARQSGENITVARLPLAWVESKIAQGIPVLEMEAHEITAMLRAEGLDNFITYGGKL